MLHPQRAPAHLIGLPDTPPATPARLSGEVFGRLINLSGRRRFTSQRLVLYALLAAQGREGALQVSRDALAAFCEAHLLLIDGQGSSLPGVFCDELRQAYYATGPRGGDGGHDTIQAFIVLARRVHEAIAAGSVGAPALLDQLVERGTPLLAVLNQITQVYEDLARRQATQARKQLVDVMGEIEAISMQARIVAFNAQVVAAHAGKAGSEFSVVAGELSRITGRIDELVRDALRGSAA
ncbi:methyl-accepting chemotaxis sensory transducer [Leptothrix cholodnii SP-6]|uniref:Methyl-accepting chemotaxis sensory transducer n=1 Tax=Leptothrix cholodnii (strain ATCC 51168 / LMG 8142 / SP-6) TaxID=395495 RepID=B1Y4J2_LEPCP|nr:methyl-accepting chemotaxis protein [Leptothrix cholodnii]ACB33431.1 methyl-accepting chemotaxis sensory transducer [Leptothrix cholodnii SP-6]